MDQIDDQEYIASDDEVSNVDAEPIGTDSDHDDLDLTTLALDESNSDIFVQGVCWPEVPF